MPREIHADTAAALSGEALTPIKMVALAFASGVMRLWTGIGELVWNGFTWYGIGTLGKIGPIEETTEQRAVGITLSLSAIPAEVLEKANRESWQGRSATVYYAVLQKNPRRFVGTPINRFSGFMDQMILVEGSEAAIELRCESKRIDLERTRARRYTAEDQRAEYPGDAGCDQVAALQEVTIRLPTT